MTFDLLVGSYSPSLQVLHFDPAAKTLELSTLAQPAFERYTWISRHPTLKNIYYATQSPADGGDGIISPIKVIGGSGSAYQLEVLQSLPTGGSSPCHLGVKPDGSELGISNYNTGTVMICKLDSDGKISSQQRVDYNQSSEPTGPHPTRQDASHPHGCYYTEGNNLLIPDLGCDVVRFFGQDRLIKTPAGSGPRHLVIYGSHVYILNELDNTITIHSLQQSDAKPSEIKSYSILAKDCKSPAGKGMTAAEIMISKDGRHLYATNRDEANPEGDSIAHFQVSEDGLSLSKQGDARPGLPHLRGAELFDYQGQGYLITGTKNAKGVVVYLRDSATGALTEVARNMDVDQPSSFACVV